MIKFHESAINKKVFKYLEDVVNQNNYSNGKYIYLVKEILHQKFGFTNFLLTNSATASLEIAGLIYKQLSINKLQIPSFTFSSTANGFLRSGLDIEFEDISQNDGMVNYSKSINNKKVPVLVHFAGSSYNFDKLDKKQLDFKNMIEDAAQSLGVKYNNKQVGTFGRIGCVSFHHTKNIHGGFGGLINFKYKSDLEIGQYILDRGTDRSKAIVGLKEKYEWKTVGSSFEMTELSAAVLYSQIEIFDEIIDKRKIIHDYYSSFFNNFSNSFITQEIDINLIQPNYHSFYLVLKKHQRRQFLEKLYRNNVQAYIGYVPLHSSYFGKKNFKEISLPVTEYFGKNLIRLPIHSNMGIREARYVCKTIIKILKNEI